MIEWTQLRGESDKVRAHATYGGLYLRHFPCKATLSNGNMPHCWIVAIIGKAESTLIASGYSADDETAALICEFIATALRGANSDQASNQPVPQDSKARTRRRTRAKKTRT